MPRALRAGLPARLAVAILAIAFAGCSSQPRLTQPDPLDGNATADALLAPADLPAGPVPGVAPGFYPLTLGNLWVYRGRIVEAATFDDGTSYRDVRRYRERDRMICVETIGDRPYVVTRVRQAFRYGEEVVSWVRYRQGRDGLFESDMPQNIPPACEAPDAAGDATAPAAGIEAVQQREFDSPDLQAAVERARAEARVRLDLARRAVGMVYDAEARVGRGPTPAGLPVGEITRLAYPLHVGARWVIRSDPRFTAAVVAHETLDLPVGRRAGFKVRIRSEFFGPHDRVLFWVSRLGFLQFDTRVVAAITDEGGNVLGRLVLREHRELTNYDLRAPGRSGDPHAAPEPVAGR